LAWGIISQPDVLAAALAGGAEPSAAALARQPAVAVPLDMTLRDAVSVMLSEDLTHVVVLDRRGERPIGVLSMADVTRVIGWGGG
jgi:CBS domain-containing protein